jgi:hypothetical protein
MLRRKPTMEVAEAVELGVTIFAEMEERAKEIKLRAKELREPIEAIKAAGLIGNLEATSTVMQIEALTKKFEADLFVIHSHLTQRAKALGIDIPSTMDGGR